MKYIKHLSSTLITFGLLLATQLETANFCYATESPQTDQKMDPVAEPPPAGQWPHALLSLAADQASFSRYAFLVDKKRRTLTVWEHAPDGLKLVRAEPTDIGRLQGDKMMSGDHKTPEGIYLFQTQMDGNKVDFSRYGVRIFTMDYPNYFDRLDKKTGYGIWLHAIPDTQTLLRGSRGCVVVRNKVIEELTPYIELKKTPIVVVDSVDYLPPDKWAEKQKSFMSWLESWRASWSGKNLDAYMAMYGDRFQGNNMNKTQWRAYKQSLAEKYKFIEIGFKDVQIFAQGSKVVFRFIQSYKSDLKTDLGAKMIYAMRTGGPDSALEIVGETWEPITKTH